ncbi:DUF2971 domain-containing protein [Pontibacter sp. CAU 1760]
MTKLLAKENPPQFLYKYRNWSDKFHKRLITHQEIYFSKPSEFNDPFDGNIPVRWDLLSYNDCLQKNLEITQIFHKDKPFKVQKQIAKQVTDSKKLWHPATVKKESLEDILKWNNLIGLVSLSEKKDDILMWSHYSEFHKGFAVGFTTNSLLSDYEFDYLNKIKYQDKYPLISGHQDTTDRFSTKFFTKYSDWSYEKEWRISKNHISDRVVQLKKETFSEVILGCKISELDKSEITQVIRESFGDSISIFQAKMASEEFGLEIIKI